MVKAALRLSDSGGRPLARADVVLRQTRHRFLFGSNLFLLNVQDASAAQRLYQERFAQLLNFATLPFYWGGYEKTPGQTDERRVRAMAAWCRRHGIAPKGHPLLWHQLPPAWRADRTDAEMRRLQMERIEREVAVFSGQIEIWDVVNEAVIMPRFTRHPNHMTPLVRAHGVVPILKEAFARARRANPRAMLLLNDFDHTEAYERLIAECLDAGVDMDAIGIQSHMHQGYLGDERVWDTCERFARFGKPLHWTEATLISGDLRPENDFHTPLKDWHSTPAGEARQAEEVASFYSTLYAHPAVAAITWWDFRDGCWLGAPSGLLRDDMTPKPAYERLQELIQRTWGFEERTARTDAEGALSFSGPLGQYEVSVGNRTLRFDHDGNGERRLQIESAGGG
jgi:GH35 family endo-1,4-beta-xylanase